MANINIIYDKPLIEEILNYDIIIVGTGIHNALGNGFQYDIKINFPNVEDAVKKTSYADARKLGTVTVIPGSPTFCVGFIHKGGFRKDLNPVFLSYESLKEVLQLIDENFDNKRIATSMIGCSLYDGNGDKEKVLQMFNELSSKNEYYIYDYEQKDYRILNNDIWAKITSLVNKIPYSALRELKDEYIKQRKYGIYELNDKKQQIRRRNIIEMIEQYNK
jgi:hypothetical protein